MSKLDDMGYDVTIEICLMMTFLVSLGVMIASLFVKFLQKIYFSFFSLLPVFLSILLIMENNDLWYGFGANFLGTVYGHNVYQETILKFELILVPTMIFSVLSFVALFSSSIVAMLAKKGENHDKQYGFDTAEEGEMGQEGT